MRGQFQNASPNVFPFLMRWSIVAFLCASLLIGGCSSDQDASPSKAPQTNQEAQSGKSYKTDPKPVPDITLETMDGEKINLADQTGKVVLINFWATWCAPCRKEIPDLIDLYAQFQSEGLKIIGIAVDQDGAEVVKPFVQKQKINYPIVLDPDQSIESHFDAMYGLPTTYVVSPEGQIVRRILGIFPIEEMKPELKEMLNAQSESAEA